MKQEKPKSRRCQRRTFSIFLSGGSKELQISSNLNETCEPSEISPYSQIVSSIAFQRQQDSTTCPCYWVYPPTIQRIAHKTGCNLHKPNLNQLKQIHYLIRDPYDIKVRVRLKDRKNTNSQVKIHCIGVCVFLVFQFIPYFIHYWKITH